MEKKSDLPAVPRHLRPETAKWWQAIVGEYDLEPADLCVLEAAYTCWDRAAAARETIDKLKDGPYIKDRFGQLKEHPACAIEQNSTRLFLAAMRQVGLGLEPPGANRLPNPVAPMRRK